MVESATLLRPKVPFRGKSDDSVEQLLLYIVVVGSVSVSSSRYLFRRVGICFVESVYVSSSRTMRIRLRIRAEASGFFGSYDAYTSSYTCGGIVDDS